MKKFCGIEMTEEQQKELEKELTENILERYDYETYWDISLIEDFCAENNIPYGTKPHKF